MTRRGAPFREEPSRIGRPAAGPAAFLLPGPAPLCYSSHDRSRSPAMHPRLPSALLLALLLALSCGCTSLKQKWEDAGQYMHDEVVRW